MMKSIYEYLINNHLKTPPVKLVDKTQFFTKGTDWEDKHFCVIHQYNTDNHVWIAKVKDQKAATPSNDYFRYETYYIIRYTGKDDDNELYFGQRGIISININSGTFEEPDNDMLKVVNAVEQYVEDNHDMLNTNALIHADAYKKYYDI